MKIFPDDSEKLLDDITRLVDNEIKDTTRVKILREIISRDDFLRAEYEIQLSVKKLIKCRSHRLCVPSFIKNIIVQRLINKSVD